MKVLVMQHRAVPSADTKDTNPKAAFGDTKMPLSLWPAHVTAGGSLALLDGALKYGRANWRVAGVRASTYHDAAARHLAAWFEGEDADPDSGLGHLHHVLACVAIVLDAEACGNMTDDRMVAGGHRKAMDALTPHVQRLKALHAHRQTPKHYSIADSVSSDRPTGARPPVKEPMPPSFAGRLVPRSEPVGIIEQLDRADFKETWR